MSDFGMFESDEAAQAKPQVQARLAARKMDAAIDTVRVKFGRFLLGATGIDEFGDRWHYSKHDIRAAVEPYVFPNTGTMRRLQNAMKADWKLAHPYKLALDHDEAGYGQMATDNTRRNQDLDETYHPSSGNLVPQGDFEGWKNSVDQGGPEKVESHAFTPGGDSGSDRQARRHQATDDDNYSSWMSGQADHESDVREREREDAEKDGKKEAARLVADIYTDFARSNGMRVASLDTLDRYASTGIHDADYRLLQALIIQAAECDEDGDDEDTESEAPSEAPSESEGDESDSGDDEGEDYDFGGEEASEGDDESDDDGDGDHDDDDHHTDEDSDEDYDFGGGDEGQGGGEQYTVPEQAPELSPEMMGEIPQDNPQGAAPVPPEVIDSLLGLPEGTIEQLLLEEVEQGAQGGDPSGFGGPPPAGPEQGAPQGGGDDFFGGGGGDNTEPPRVARRRSARSFWAAEGDPEQESEGGGGEQAAPAQDPAAAMGGGDPAAMGGQPMMPPPGSQAVTPPQPPAPLENQPAEDALLDTANQAIMQMIDQETAEYQQIIDPLSQALQAIQFAQQVEQSEHPMDVTPPQGTVDVSPAAAPGGAGNPMQQQARRRVAAGDPYSDRYGPIDRGGPSIDDPTNGPTREAVHPDINKALRSRFEGGGDGAWHPDKPDTILHNLGNFWDGPREVKHLGGGEMEYTCPYTGRKDRFNSAGYYSTETGEHRPWSSAYDDYKTSARRQAKVEFGIRNAAALIASRYRLSATGHQMLLNAALGRRGYEHVVEALKLVPAEVRKAAALHMSHLFAAGNQRFNRDVFMKTVMASNPRDRAGDAWRDGRDRGEREHGRQDMDEINYRDPDYLRSQLGEPTGETYPMFDRDGNEIGRGSVHHRASRGRLPFDRPRLAGETLVPTAVLDAFEHYSPGIPRVDDGNDTNDLPPMPGANPNGKNATSQKAVDRFQRWQKSQQQKGLATTQGEAGVHNFLQTRNPVKKRVGPDAQNMIHEYLGLQPDSIKTPKAKPVKAVNPVLKGKGGKTPAAPEAKAPAPKAAPKTAASSPASAYQRGYAASGKMDGPEFEDASARYKGDHQNEWENGWFDYASEIPHKYKDPEKHQEYHDRVNGKKTSKTASFFTRKVPGWRWDDHLSGYLSKEARAFTCSCGQKIASPSYKTCSCGKVWNVYAIGDTHHLASDTAEVYIAREIPVRPGVIMANKKMAGEAQKSHRELLAEIDKLADWTKYDSPDPTRDPKVKPPSTTIKSQPGDWTNRDFTGPTKGQWREPEPTELPRKTRKKK